MAAPQRPTPYLFRDRSYSTESTLNGTATVTFPWTAREVQITNDSPVDNLQYRLDAAESYRTLKPLESSTLEHVGITALYLSTSASVAYRVWGLG